jgi:hypothetical protein
MPCCQRVLSVGAEQIPATIVSMLRRYGDAVAPHASMSVFQILPEDLAGSSDGPEGSDDLS